jgi:hypothetical protein
MPAAESPTEPISSLLQRGLDHYGRNEIDEAVDCWRQVLKREPHHATARDYLETAGVFFDEPRGADIINLGAARAQLASSVPPAPSKPEIPPADAGVSRLVRQQIERLLRDHRYEEALALLYSERAANPANREIPRSIRLLRERLSADYARRLGDLDRVPLLSPGALELDAEEQQVAALVDGISSYFDIASASPIGRLPTLRILCALESSGQLTCGTTERPEASALSGISSTRRASATIATPVSDASGESPPPTLRRPRDTQNDEQDYDELFARATQAYLVRDMGLAIELFSECCRRRPEDPRPHHNLKTLSRRVGK